MHVWMTLGCKKDSKMIKSIDRGCPWPQNCSWRPRSQWRDREGRIDGWCGCESFPGRNAESDIFLHVGIYRVMGGEAMDSSGFSRMALVHW